MLVQPKNLLVCLAMFAISGTAIANCGKDGAEKRGKDVG